MSCNYAEGLSEYDNKGVLGTPETFDSEKDVEEKSAHLADWILSSKHVVVHTGAGISTSAGIPDFRGPNGVWTLEREGKKPTINIAFEDAVPTKTHMALKAMLDAGHIQYIVSQNIDGLHLKSGVPREKIAELHGNIFIENCNKCRRQYIRSTQAPTVGQKPTGNVCKGGANSRPCRGGQLLDNVLDWEHDLPDKDLDLATMHSTIADLNVCLGTTLQIMPSGNLPLKNKKYGGKVAICNLQPTKQDEKSDLKISTYVDDVLVRVAKRLGIEIPDYSPETDPTKLVLCEEEWTLSATAIKDIEAKYNERVKSLPKKRRANDFYAMKPKKEIIKKKKEEDLD